VDDQLEANACKKLLRRRGPVLGTLKSQLSSACAPPIDVSKSKCFKKLAMFPTSTSELSDCRLFIMDQRMAAEGKWSEPNITHSAAGTHVHRMDITPYMAMNVSCLMLLSSCSATVLNTLDHSELTLVAAVRAPLASGSNSGFVTRFCKVSTSFLV